MNLRRKKQHKGHRMDARATISYRMSKIRSKDTRIELILRRALTDKGLRYRKHYSKAPGCPDIVFVSLKVAVFCDSSFWHGRNWPRLSKRLRSQFWIDKIKGNITRDRKVDRQLGKDGWIVLRFWEEDIHSRIDWCVGKILKIVAQRRKGAAKR